QTGRATLLWLETRIEELNALGDCRFWFPAHHVVEIHSLRRPRHTHRQRLIRRTPALRATIERAMHHELVLVVAEQDDILDRRRQRNTRLREIRIGARALQWLAVGIAIVDLLDGPAADVADVDQRPEGGF